MRVNNQHVVKWNFKANLSFIALYALNFPLISSFAFSIVLNCSSFLESINFTFTCMEIALKKLQHNIKINYRDRDGTKGWTLLSLLHLFLFVERFFAFFCVLVFYYQQKKFFFTFGWFLLYLFFDFSFIFFYGWVYF